MTGGSAGPAGDRTRRTAAEPAPAGAFAEERAAHFAETSTPALGAGAARELLIIALGALAVFVISARFDVINNVIAWIYRHETWQLDEIFSVAVYLVAALLIYVRRRRRDLRAQIARRLEAEERIAGLMPELERARDEAAALRSILPICSSCRRVRDDRGNWHQVETYFEVYYRTRLDGGMCPDCARNAYAHGPESRPHGPRRDRP